MIRTCKAERDCFGRLRQHRDAVIGGHDDCNGVGRGGNSRVRLGVATITAQSTTTPAVRGTAVVTVALRPKRLRSLPGQPYRHFKSVGVLAVDETMRVTSAGAFRSVMNRYLAGHLMDAPFKRVQSVTWQSRNLSVAWSTAPERAAAAPVERCWLRLLRFALRSRIRRRSSFYRSHFH